KVTKSREQGKIFFAFPSVSNLFKVTKSREQGKIFFAFPSVSNLFKVTQNLLTNHENGRRNARKAAFPAGFLSDVAEKA
ncbi:MAG: hypothetical protein IJ196_01585, partial [Prevotella sp.]|nr:hypothetical protein [Prevotella sp.]